MNVASELIGAFDLLASELKRAGDRNTKLSNDVTTGEQIDILKYQTDRLRAAKRFMLPPFDQGRNAVSVFQLPLVKLPAQACVFESMVFQSNVICVLAFEIEDGMHDNETAIGFCVYRMDDQAPLREQISGGHEIIVFNPNYQDASKFCIDGKNMVFDASSIQLPHGEMEIAPGATHTAEEAEAHVHNMAMQAVACTIQYLVLLNSPGVNTVKIVEPSPLKNKMLSAKGHPILHPYYTLDILVNPNTMKIYKQFTKEDYRNMFVRYLS